SQPDAELPHHGLAGAGRRTDQDRPSPENRVACARLKLVEREAVAPLELGTKAAHRSESMTEPARARLRAGPTAKKEAARSPRRRRRARTRGRPRCGPSAPA